MADSRGFTAVTAARTRAADVILTTQDMLKAFVDLGGTKGDLEPVRDAGREAEAFNQAQGSMASSGKIATVEVLQRFLDVQREYVLLLAVLRAIRGRLEEANPADPDITRLDDIIANHAALTVLEAKQEGAGKKTAASKAQENVRAEIERDLVDLIGFGAIAGALEERKWTPARLNALLDKTRGFAGKLGNRAATKGAAKDATKAERAAVTRQNAAWSAAYGLLSALGRKDSRVRALLAEARR